MPIAKFSGSCKCGARVEAGDTVQFADRRVSACGACSEALKPAAQVPSITLTVRVEVITYKSEKGFMIVKGKLEGAQTVPASELPFGLNARFALKGNFNAKVGDIIEATGRFTRSQYGDEFEVLSVLASLKVTEAGAHAYLAQFPQVGPKRATQLLTALGGPEAVFAALKSDPAKLTAVKGITLERAEAMSVEYNAKIGLHATALFVRGLGLSERMVGKIFDAYGEHAERDLTEDPYRLLDIEGIGFRTCDKLATEKLGLQKNDPRRLRAATFTLFAEMEQQGHTYGQLADLLYL